MRVGYIGLGAMGGTLARHLVGRHPLIVLDTSKDAVAALKKLGAQDAASPAQLARDSDIVLLCLPRSTDVEEVIFGHAGLVEGLGRGKVVVDQTSGVPSATREFARRLREIGVSMLDAPVSGAMATAVAGTISIIASGPKDVFEQALPVLKSISVNVFYCGERIGNGQTMKAVNNMMNVGCRLATLEAVAMGRKYGLTLKAMTEALNGSMGRNYTTQGMLPAIIEGRQSTKFALALQLKDMDQALKLGLEHGVPMPMGSVGRALLQIALNRLGENAQLEQLIEAIASMAGTRLAEEVRQP